MATSGRPLHEHERQRIIRLRALELSIRRVAAEERVSTQTVQKVLKVLRLPATGMNRG